MIHDVGDTIRLWAVFRNEAGVQTVPSTVEVTARTPAKAVVVLVATVASIGDEEIAEAATGEVLSGVTGVYRADLDITQSGRWYYRWAGTGAVAQAAEGSIDVRQRRVG